MGLFDFFTQEIAIDLGTANTLIIYNDKVVVDEPSIVAIDRASSRVIAVGKKAMQMHGKTHENIKTNRPLKDGVIADFQAAEHMIREMIKMINPKKRFFNPSLKMVICIPSGITEVETNPELIENTSIQAFWKNYETELHKKRSTFTKKI